MAEAYIVGVVRTAIGTRKGPLGGIHQADLGAHVLKAHFTRTGADPSAVDDVIMGCVMQRRRWALAATRGCQRAGPRREDRPAVRVVAAVHFAAQGIMSGAQALVVAAGVENMAMIPLDANSVAGTVLAGESGFATRRSPSFAALSSSPRNGACRGADGAVRPAQS